MLGRKRGRFNKGERVHTLVCVNSVEERERASTPRRGKGVSVEGRERDFQH
jgi:hypothetical protein